MSRVVIPPHPGVLSALGLAAAPERVELLASFHRPLSRIDRSALATAFRPLFAAAGAALPGEGVVLARFADCRFAGQGYEVTVPAPGDDPAALAATFRTAHQARFAHADPEQPIDVVNLRVTAERPVAAPPIGRREGGGEPTPQRREIVTRDGAVVRAEVWPLGELPAGLKVDGPAVLAGPDATGLIEPGWRGTVHASGAIIVERR